MHVVPESPAEFFTVYLPGRFEEVRGALAGVTSAGSMVFRVGGDAAWTFRVHDGELRITEGHADDVILQVDVSVVDFGPLFVQGAQQHSDTLRPEQQVMAFKALTIDASKAQLVRNVPGTVAFVVSDGAQKHQIAVTPGSRPPKLDAPDCKLECTMVDFLDLQTGKANPMQLVMGGKLKIVGNAQLPMALSSVFA